MRLLAITAHPDDESGGFGGTLALYAARGVEVGVVCATRGEAGRHRGHTTSREELARVRAGEFHRACKFLGASWQEIYEYPDAGLPAMRGLTANARSQAGRSWSGSRTVMPVMPTAVAKSA